MASILRAEGRRALPTVGLLALVGGCHRAVPQPGCLMTDARSRLAWAPSDGVPGISGSVLATESGAAVSSAAVLVEPGQYRSGIAPDGAFHLPTVPPGRYVVRVQSIGRETAEGSVTVGRQGLVLLVALATPPWGLRECAAPEHRAPET